MKANGEIYTINNKSYKLLELALYKTFFNLYGNLYLEKEDWQELFLSWFRFCNHNSLWSSFAFFLLDCGVDFRESDWWEDLLKKEYLLPGSVNVWNVLFPDIDKIKKY